MPRDAQSTHWPHSQQSTIAVDCISNEQLIQIQSINSTALSPGLQGPPWSGQEMILGLSLTGPNGLSDTHHTLVQPSTTDATRPWRREERNMALGYGDPQDLTDFNPQIQFPFPFGGNGSSQAGNGHLSNQVFTDTNPQFPFLFGRNGHSQAGHAADPQSTMTGPSVQSPVPFAAGLPVIELVAAEDGLRDVGSRKIQKASGRRRKKEGSLVCPFRNTGCHATFTASHNMQPPKFTSGLKTL
ncbi:hypothetical protein JOM56_014379 [Amanita muscaria]